MTDYTITGRRAQDRLITAASISIFMFSLDYSMVNISLPTITRYFHVGLSEIALLPQAYILMVTGTLLGFSKLGDLKGYRKVFIAGLAVFIAGSLLCSIAPSLRLLILCRVFQSLGEAMFSPMAIAMVTTFLPHDIKGKALGIMALAQGLGFCVGPAIGGFINADFVWRGVFFINVPVGIAAILLALKAVPTRQPKAADPRFDLPGAALVFVALVALVFAIGAGGKMGWTHPLVLGSVAVSAVTFPLFFIRERKVPYPLLNLEFFKNRDFSLANTAAFFGTAVVMGTALLFPFYLEMVHGIPVARAGMILMLPSFLMMVCGPVAGKLSDRFGSRGLCAFGMALVISGFTTFNFSVEASGLASVIIALILVGSGIGLFIAPNNKLVLSHAPLDKQGIASGVYKTMLNMGAIFGIAVFPLIIMQLVGVDMAALHRALGHGRCPHEVLVAGFHRGFSFGMVLCALALIASILARDRKVQEAP